MVRMGIIMALALLASCSEAPGDPASADSYAMTLAVTPAAGDGVQRVTLPAAAIAALAREDGGDLRIFDGDGRTLSLAEADSVKASWRSHQVEAIPVAMPKPGAPTEVSISVEGAAQSVTVDAVNAEAAAEANPPAALLLDARKLADPVVALELDCVIPKGKLVDLSVAASGDLKIWEPLAEKVLVGRDAQTDRTVTLPGVPLKDRYIRISWQLDEAVIIRGARVITGKSPPPRPLGIATSGLRLSDPHSADFAVPLGVPIVGLRVAGQRGDGVIPLTLLGRSSPEEAWEELALGALRGGAPAELTVLPSRLAQYQLRADSRSAGFGSAPQVTVLVAPRTVLAAFNGKPPYRLAIGHPAAKPTFFKPAELLGPGQGNGADLPEASLASTAPPSLSLAPPQRKGPPWRKIALWGVLLAATALLALAAVRLLRANRSIRPAG